MPRLAVMDDFSPLLPLAVFGGVDWLVLGGYFALMFTIGHLTSRRKTDAEGYFLGETELFDVAVEGRDTYLLAKARAGDGLVPGVEVCVGFDPRDVLVFPRE